MKSNILFLKGLGYKKSDILLTLDIKDGLYIRVLNENGYNSEKEKEIRTAKLKDPNLYFALKQKVAQFQLRGNCTRKFTFQDVLDKFGPNPVCYLSGLPIDYLDSSNYSLDHVIPVAKGGNSNFENLQLSNCIINIMKFTHTPKELLSFCQMIVNYSRDKQPQELQLNPPLPQNLSIY